MYSKSKVVNILPEFLGFPSQMKRFSERLFEVTDAFEKNIIELVKKNDCNAISLALAKAKLAVNKLAQPKKNLSIIVDAILLENAAKYGKLKVMKYVVEKLHINASLEMYRGSGGTSVYHAASKGNEAVMDYLIECGVAVNTRFADDCGATPLMVAATATVARSLIKAGADIEAINKMGYRAIHYACAFDRVGVVKELLASKADFLTKNASGNTPFMCAVNQGCVEIMKILQGAGADVHEPNELDPEHIISPLMSAAVKGYFPAAEYLISLHADVNFGNPAISWTALNFAIREKFDDILDLLLANNADIHSETVAKDTPLFRAVEHGTIVSMKLLLDAGAKLDVLSDYGDTPLTLAISGTKPNLNKIGLLLDHDPDISFYTKLGQTANTRVIKTGNVAIVKMLLEKHISLAKGDAVREKQAIFDMLCMAVYCNKESILNYLLSTERYKRIFFANIEKLFAAQIDYESIDSINFMLDRKYIVLSGKDTNAKTFVFINEVTINKVRYNVTQKLTPLMGAVMKGNLGVIKVLLGAKADITTVIEAEVVGKADTSTGSSTESSTETSADPTLVREMGKLTALICARSTGNVEIVQLLLSRLILEKLRPFFDRNLKEMQKIIAVVNHFSKRFSEPETQFDEVSNLWLNIKNEQEFAIPKSFKEKSDIICIPIDTIVEVVQKICSKKQDSAFWNSIDSTFWNSMTLTPDFRAICCDESLDLVTGQESGNSSNSPINVGEELTLTLQEKLKQLAQMKQCLLTKLEKAGSRITDKREKILVQLKELDGQDFDFSTDLESLVAKFSTCFETFKRESGKFDAFLLDISKEHMQLIQETIQEKKDHLVLKGRISELDQDPSLKKIFSELESSLTILSQIEQKLSDVSLRLERQLKEKMKAERTQEKEKERIKRDRKAEEACIKKLKKEKKKQAIETETIEARALELQKAHEARLAQIREQKRLKREELERAMKEKERKEKESAAKKHKATEITLKAQKAEDKITNSQKIQEIQKIEKEIPKKQKEETETDKSITIVMSEKLKTAPKLEKLVEDPELAEIGPRLAGIRPLKIVFS